MRIKLIVVGDNQTVLKVGPNLIFFSYETPVAAWTPETRYICTAKHYSKTTTKHINHWCGSSPTVVPQFQIDALLDVNA